MNHIGVIIPALDQNEYHELGDLAPFGDITLLDWKIAQIKRVVPDSQIYISSPSESIGARARRRNVHFIARDPALSLTGMITYSIAQITQQTALWANVTSPFVSPDDYLEYINRYQSLNTDYDSLATATRLNEYAFYREKPLNFQLHAHISRRSIDPLFVLTNGCFIIQKDLALELNTYFGRSPFLYPVDRLTAMEIKDLVDLTIANDLLALYFRHKEMNRE